MLIINKYIDKFAISKLWIDFSFVILQNRVNSCNL